jgi:Ca-activated chloride channel family protein
MRLLALFLWVLGGVAWGDSGVLLPRDKDHPDAAILSLQEMTVKVTIDNGDARVFITQIFANHTARIEEGTYVFALPAGSTVSDFATWDGPVRIPAVILERKRAEEVYDQAKMQAIDPGLLEAGDREGDAKSASTFTAKIVPIPAYGTKRVEIEYHQRLETNALRQAFVLPLQPTTYAKQSAAKFRLDLEISSDEPMLGFAASSKVFLLKVEKLDPHIVVASFEGSSVSFDEDFSAGWRLDPAATDKLALTTYRNPRHALPAADEMAPKKQAEEPGFFLAQTIVGEPKTAASLGVKVPRNVIVLFDTSLSMQWDKLERSYAALEGLLLSLTAADHFNVVLFNQDVTEFSAQPVTADAAKVREALEFVKASRLRGGTDLGKALAAGLAQASLPDSSLILLTDGDSDRGTTVVPRQIAAAYAKQRRASPQRPRTHVFAVGDDANLPLLRELAAGSAKDDEGVMESVLSTEPIEPKLSLFLSHLVTRPVAGLTLEVEPKGAVKTVYPLGGAPYAGSIAAWVGDYAAPAKDVGFTLSTGANTRVELPVQALGHPQLPRLWAQARVNALLDKIARDGETREAVDEIIELSRKYKFVTPYTSFLAAPRSLLRPRVIRPGDPVLRVHTDPSITSVIALFPFGLTKSLRHLSSEDKVASGRAGDAQADRLWETRFLAPTDMKDGTYTVRLILRDATGRTYSEAKTFVIASTAPTVRIRMDRTRYRRGELIRIEAEATATTRVLTARLEGAPALDLRWNPAAGASTGQMRVPETMPPGAYTLSVTAEDVAHNMGSQEVQLEIVP